MVAGTTTQQQQQQQRQPRTTTTTSCILLQALQNRMIPLDYLALQNASPMAWSGVTKLVQSNLVRGLCWDVTSCTCPAMKMWDHPTTVSNFARAVQNTNTLTLLSLSGMRFGFYKDNDDDDDDDDDDDHDHDPMQLLWQAVSQTSTLQKLGLENIEWEGDGTLQTFFQFVPTFQIQQLNWFYPTLITSATAKTYPSTTTTTTTMTTTPIDQQLCQALETNVTLFDFVGTIHGVERRQIDYLCLLNRGGRRLLVQPRPPLLPLLPTPPPPQSKSISSQDSTLATTHDERTIPLGLWPLILERITKSSLLVHGSTGKHGMQPSSFLGRRRRQDSNPWDHNPYCGQIECSYYLLRNGPVLMEQSRWSR